MLSKNNEPKRLKVDELTAKEDVRIRAQEALQAVLAEQRPRKQKKSKTPKERIPLSRGWSRR